jgi:Mn-dependent DtxR family transcriptional regulator
MFYFKWDERPPKPALRMIATRLGLSVRTVRETVKGLEGLGLV